LREFGVRRLMRWMCRNEGVRERKTDERLETALDIVNLGANELRARG